MTALAFVCPSCTGSAFINVDLLNGVGVKAVERCLTCGLLLATYERGCAAAGYERVDSRAYDRSIGKMRRREAKQHVAAVKALLGSVGVGFSWLDIGAGAGHLLRAAQVEGFSVLAVEPDPIGQRMVEEATGIQAVASLNDLAQVPHDVVSMLDVLEHIDAQDIDATVASIRTLLKPGGLWVIKVPSSDGVFYRVAMGAQKVVPNIAKSALQRLWLTEYRAPHRIYFNESNLRRLLARHGFTTVATRYEPTVALSSVLNRLTLDPTISRPKAYALLPIAAILRAIEVVRGRTDSLVLIAKKGVGA